MCLLFLLVIPNSSENSAIGAAPYQMSLNVALIRRRRLFKLRQYVRLNFYFSPVFINLPAQFPFFFSKNKKKANGQQMHEGIGREEVAKP